MNLQNKKILIGSLCVLLAGRVFSLDLTQTVRGTAIDRDSEQPLIGVKVTLYEHDSQRSARTNMRGAFKFEDVAIGRVSLRFMYTDYEPKVIPNIEVNSAQEVVMQVFLRETVEKDKHVATMDKVVVKAEHLKGKSKNDMSLLSSRSIAVEQSDLYAGGYDDPSRVVVNYAGVANTGKNSDIIVRGNSPKYMQWKLDGIEITSPYHFNDQNASFGAFTALNNSLLRTSDFNAGAFAPEYGNALSSVFDVSLRNGNNEKVEVTAGIGLIGTDCTIEGPFAKNYNGSFLLNYRYSTISLINKFGFVDLPGVLNFQDGTCKLYIPMRKLGTLSLFAFGGLDDFSFEDIRASTFTTPGNRYMSENESEDWDKEHSMLNAGLKHTISVNENSYLKTKLSYSTSGIDDEIYEKKTIEIFDSVTGEHLRDSVHSERINFDNRLRKSVYRGALTFSTKVNEKNKLQIGAKYSLHEYDYLQRNLGNDGEMFTSIDFKKDISTIQDYLSWQFRLNDRVTFVSGFHNMNVLVNNKSTIEPRFAFEWRFNESNMMNAGYGKHSTMESVHHYYAQVKEDGNVVEPNQDLGMLKAHHVVLGYNRRFTAKLMGRIEGYYQYLYDLPVESNKDSYFATINEGVDYKYVDLVNEGTGKNYGIELSLERFFDKNYYYLANVSMFNSTYTALDGKERNTRYNNNFLSNLLIGKEFRNFGKNNNRTLGLNGKVFFRGGQKIIPLLRDENGNLAVEPENNKYWDHGQAYENALDNLYQINISLSYTINRKRTAHELFLDLQNITNAKADITEFYDMSEPDSVGNVEQMGFFPNIMYRIYF
ncbi:MAG: TonB-dependent receptor [Chitinivibrionales bacterium]|nr:TonB-dependent receptor [Chitinivibrionales bacterium]